MTRVLVLGATGRTGLAVVRQLRPDVQVAAAVRTAADLSRLAGVGRPLRSAVVDIDDVSSIRNAAAGVDVIVNAVRLRGDIAPSALVDLHARIREGAGQPDDVPGPLIVTVGGAGALRLPDGRRFWQDRSFPERTLPRGVAHARLREHLESAPESGSGRAPWAYLIPPPAYLPDGVRTGHHSAWPPSTDESEFLRRRISYADFADAVCAAAQDRRTGTQLIATTR